jgi:class 3 adenylate cyclase/tetratricopeptide (TPR) repeat protein
MTFEEVLDQAIAMLQRRGRLTYGALKRQFHLDDAYLEDLKAELIEGQRLAVDEAGHVPVWAGAKGFISHATPPAVSSQDRLPLAYTPSYLAAKILTSKSTLEGERKQVTVLFADLKGSMELLIDRDPEEARQLLDPVLERMMAAVHHYEGTVNQIMGDGIMALFGAPIAHEDHAIRACYAALAMQAAIRYYSTEVQQAHGVEVHIRVGLHSGEVVVRAISNDLHMDYSAIGQTTHLAARMEQLATPGTIRLTATTLRLVEGLVQVEALGPFPIKGLPEPVEVFELVGASTIRQRLQATAERGLTRFVGRQYELATLQQALAHAGAGHGQVMALVGEAGVGKSRLVYEFVHAHYLQGWRALESTSVSYGKATPYFPIIDLLRRYCAIEDRDDTRTVRAKMTGQVLTLDAALQDTIPALLALLEVLPDDNPFSMLDPPQRRQHTLEALKRVLLRESQVQPLVLVFEDLHWIDAETQALLNSLVESLPTAQLLLVNYRPEYQHGWGNKTYYTQLRLDPLPPARAEELLQALLGDDPDLVPLTQLLVERTEGNPFFLEESVRALVEIGALVGERGAYRLAHTLPTIQVPATVQAVLAARIDRLPPEEKQLLQIAAVIGTEVPLALLQTMAEVPEMVCRVGLTHLQAAEFLYEARLFPEIEYTFKHALTQQVAYASLLLEQRRALHARIVEALEALAPDRVAEQVDRLAYHALRGEVWDKVVLYSHQAGTWAVGRSAYAQAGAYFDQALDALAHLPESRERVVQAIDLHRARGGTHFALGFPERQLACNEQALSLAETLGDPHRLALGVAAVANALNEMGDNVRAFACAQRGLALAEAVGDLALLVSTRHNLGQICRCMGDYHRAATILRQTVELLQGAVTRTRLGRSLYSEVSARVNLAVCLAELGEFRQATATAEEGLRIAEVLQQSSSLLIALQGVCIPLLHQGRFHDALPWLERAFALCTPDLVGWHSSTLAARGYAYAMTGRLPEALPQLEQAVELARRVNRRNETRWLAYLSEVSLRADRQADARAIAEQLLALSHARGERGMEAWGLSLRGEIAAHGGLSDAAHAATSYRQALAVAETLGMRPLQAHCHYGLGTLYAQRGQQEQARMELATAIDLYRAMVMTFWLPQAEAALVQMETR